MDKRTKLIIGGASAVIIGVAGYFIVKNRKKKSLEMKLTEQKNLSTNGGSAPSGSGTKKLSQVSSAGFPLKIGSKGDNVTKLQTFLNTKFKAGLSVDGNYGKKTAEAVRKLTGSDQVDEAAFNTYVLGISAPVNQTQNMKTGFLKSMSVINPFFRMFSK